MMLEIRFQVGDSAETIRATYRCSELSLDYLHNPMSIDRPHRVANEINKNIGVRDRSEWLVIADTLVMTFSGSQTEIVGIDSYTNWQQWSRSNDLAIPELSGKGSVCLARLPDDDRVDLNVAPVYTFSENNELLQISLAEEPMQVTYVRVSDRLVLGIENSKLVSLLLQGITIDEPVSST